MVLEQKYYPVVVSVEYIFLLRKIRETLLLCTYTHRLTEKSVNVDWTNLERQDMFRHDIAVNSNNIHQFVENKFGSMRLLVFFRVGGGCVRRTLMGWDTGFINLFRTKMKIYPRTLYA